MSDTVGDLQARADWYRAMAEVAGRAAAMVEQLTRELAPHGITVAAEIDAGGITLSLDCPSPPWDQAAVTLRAVPVDVGPIAKPVDVGPPNSAVVQLAARRVAAIQEAAAAEAAAEIPDPSKLEAEDRAIVADEAPDIAPVPARLNLDELVMLIDSPVLPPRQKWSAEKDFQLLDALVHGTGLGDIAAYLRLPVASVRDRQEDLAVLFMRAEGLWPAKLADWRDAARIRAARARSA